MSILWNGIVGWVRGSVELSRLGTCATANEQVLLVRFTLIQRLRYVRDSKYLGDVILVYLIVSSFNRRTICRCLDLCLMSKFEIAI